MMCCVDGVSPALRSSAKPDGVPSIGYTNSVGFPVRAMEASISQKIKVAGRCSGCHIDLGGGPADEVARERTWNTAAVGDQTFVTPTKACSSFVEPVVVYGATVFNTVRVKCLRRTIWGTSHFRVWAASLPHPRQVCGHCKLAVLHTEATSKVTS